MKIMEKKDKQLCKGSLHMCAYICDFKTARKRKQQRHDTEGKSNKGRHIFIHWGQETERQFVIKAHHRSVSLYCTVYGGPFTS